jgi:hypothetical protein
LFTILAERVQVLSNPKLGNADFKKKLLKKIQLNVPITWIEQVTFALQVQRSPN